ncbi:hypothetical protein YC2023_012346 [Brassica napus]
MVYCYASSMEKKKQTSLNLRFGTLIAGKQDGSNQELLYKSCGTSKRGAARCVISAQGNIEDVGSGYYEN